MYSQVLVLLLLSVWFALCWCCKKVLHYVAIDRWLAYVKNKLSAVYECMKKRKERRKVSVEGQTYDLPKNGTLLFEFFSCTVQLPVTGILGDPGAASWDEAIFGQCDIFRQMFPQEWESPWVLAFFLNQYQRYLSTFPQKYYVALK